MPAGAIAFQILVMLLLALLFLHFFGAGARTFVRPKWTDSSGSAQAEIAFFGGALVTLFLGVHQRIGYGHGTLALCVASCSLVLYEWTRRTVRGRGFSVGWSEQVPQEVCDTGPCAYIRHPFYVSYMMGFAAMAIALPHIVSVLVCVAAIVWLVAIALHDERMLLNSSLATAYAAYRRHVGMFVPFLRL
jgi:protein-S-isoprenylcysteine O-methyltransferase Ste14